MTMPGTCGRGEVTVETLAKIALALAIVWLVLAIVQKVLAITVGIFRGFFSLLGPVLAVIVLAMLALWLWDARQS